MAERYQVIPRTLCFVRCNGKVLLIEYAARKGPMQGYYNGIGGHIEHGEGIIESANREILEEAGIAPADTKLKGVIHFLNFFGKNTIVFVTVSTVESEVVIESDEGKLHWVAPQDLDKVNVIKDVALMLEKIGSIGDDEVFTAKSEFDGGANLLSFDFE
ncbi:MAG: NUDIX domain-containing protein [bacterium]